MARFFRPSLKHKGKAPGSIIFTGEQKMDKPVLKIFIYSKEGVLEKEINKPGEIDMKLEEGQKLWLNIFGIHDENLIQEMGQLFDIPTLQMEDILNTDQRPKMESDGTNLYFFLKMIKYDQGKSKILGEQISIVVRNNFVITLQEQSGDVFEPLRERVRNASGKIRERGADYLVYALLDIIVDNYNFAIAHIGEAIETLEDKLIKNPDEKLMQEMYGYKMDINYLRKSIRPVDEFAIPLTKADSTYLKEDTKPFVRDLIDHIKQGLDAIETYGQILNDQINLHNTNLSNKMNQIMKVLTVFAAIFIPLTFIAGVYGTNFKFIPELEWKYSYFFFLGGTLLIGLILVFIFKKKKWF